MPPKPPPISIGTTLICETGICSSSATCGADGERALRAAPDGHGAVGVPQGRGVVRLDVALVDRRRVELALDDDRGLLRSPSSTSPSLNWKCLATLDGLVGRLAERLGDEVVVQHRRRRRCMASRTSMTGGSGSYSTLMSLSGFLGDVRADGGDGGDGVALVQHLVRRQAVAAQVPEVDGPFAQLGDAVARIGQVGAT